MNLTKFFFTVVIILINFVTKSTTTNHFGAHQNIEGLGVEDGQPNVIMQSVVLGKKARNHLRDRWNSDEDEIDSKQENTLKFLKLCKYKSANNDNEDYESIESPIDIKMERYLKMFNNKRKNKLRKFNEKLGHYSEEDLDGNIQHGKTHLEVPNKRWRNKNCMIPVRSRKYRVRDRRLQNMKCMDDFEESNEYKEKMERNSELNRKAYERFGERWDEDEENKDFQTEHHCGMPWNYPRNQYRFRRRRKYLQRPGKQREIEPCKQGRYEDWPVECKCSNSPLPQDILYLPQIDRPLRARSRPPAQRDPGWSSEY